MFGFVDLTYEQHFPLSWNALLSEAVMYTHMKLEAVITIRLGNTEG